MDLNRKKKIIFSITLLLIGALLVWAGVFWWNNLRGAGPAFRSPQDDIADIIEDKDKDLPDGENNTEFPLSLPEGFEISIFTDNVPDARVLVQDSLGNFWLSQPDEGTVSLLTIEDNEVTRVDPILQNLDRPHGLALDPENGTVLYVAETDKISRVQLYSDGSFEKIADLPGGGRHYSRTIEFGPDGKLYVSIGSSCDVCYEEDPRRAAIYRMDKDGSNFEEFATGLRNAVFFDWSFVDGRMWATEMGRDRLGDNLPPDEINIVEKGNDYGWPTCYGKNMHDTNFDKNQYIQNPCNEKTPSYIDLQAHSAPLGLVFIPEEGWPEEYWYDLLVAYHGSWNRTIPTGYKIMRFKLDDSGNVLGREDFISGWLQDGTALGRPVDILIQPGGIMYITDDHAGVVYKVSYKGN
ncbi:MAG: PQQ-dependent sugar dehydrogenase [Candidatus Spechtbacterales bacterium]|nr:PQQ-dependent sugar dehydrogenase [Candidatus Spechtbacterales bacterium]